MNSSQLTILSLFSQMEDPEERPLLPDAPSPWENLNERYCEHCVPGRIYFKNGDEQLDGIRCDVCGQLWCDECAGSNGFAAIGWSEAQYPCEPQDLRCPSCALPERPPHDAATCERCVARRETEERARAARLEALRARRAADEATVWPRMLTVPHGVSRRRADAIVAHYPSALHLVSAYGDARKHGASDAELNAMLKDIVTPDGKRVGPAASRAVRRALVQDSVPFP
jgi:hypothetical protein